MRLSEDTLSRGRALVDDGDETRFSFWVRTYTYGFDVEQVCRTIWLVRRADRERAIKFFDDVFSEHDPAASRRAARRGAVIRIGCTVLLVLGLLGGLGFLVWAVLP